MRVRAELPNPDGKLRQGMLLRVQVQLPTRQALVLPELAVQQEAEQSSVFRVGADDTVEQVPVKLGTRREGVVEVVSGLKPGDRVVVEGTVKLHPGDHIVEAGATNTPDGHAAARRCEHAGGDARPMKLSDLSIHRPVFATVVSLLLIVLGVISFTRLPLRELPDIDPPVVSISTTYTGASAAVMETRVTKVLEDAVSGIEGVDTIQSSSRERHLAASTSSSPCSATSRARPTTCATRSAATSTSCPTTPTRRRSARCPAIRT